MGSAWRLALLAHAAGHASAFVVVAPRWQAGSAAAAGVQARRLPAVPVAAPNHQQPPVDSGSFGGTSTAVVAALVAAAAAFQSSRSKSAIARRGYTYKPFFPGMERDGDPTRGPAYRTWINLRRQAKFGNGRRLRFFKQQQILKESGMTCAKGGYHKWYPNRDQWNLYKGPESHPDNPDFPAASPGYGRALRGWAPAPLACSAPKSSAGAFAGGCAPRIASAKHAVRGSRSAGSALVLKAHKKQASCSKNQGHKNNPKFWGLTKKGYQGCAVKAGQLLLKQKGMNWYPGANVSKGKDFSLHALRDGIVQWRGEYRHRQVTVIPWEYVREKCTWINPNTLGPQEYEPWMNTHVRGKRHHILRLRAEWLKTPEGKAWAQKKAEKKEKQHQIQMKIRAHRRLKKEGQAREDPRGEAVPAGGDSDSEAEA